MIDLRDVNPVPRDRIDGWARSAEGLAARQRVELAGPVATLPRRRLPAVAVAVAAALVAALVASVLVFRGGSDTTALRARSAAQRLASGKWKPSLFDSGVYNGQAVWTGHELIVWGEYAGKVSEGTAFDPGTGKLTALPDWPLGHRPGALVRWTGTEMVVLGGLDPLVSEAVPFADGAAFNPTTRQWRTIALGPVPVGTATWAGHELIVTNAVSRTSATEAASYDPTTDQWRVLANPPVSLDAAAVSAVWDGREVVYGVTAGALPDGRAAMAYDPSTNAWRLLPLPPSHNRAGLVASPQGVVQVAWNSESGSVGTLRDARLAFRANQWVPGTKVFVHGGLCSATATGVPGGAAVSCGADDVVALDFKSGSWHQLPRAPSRPGGVVFTDLVWTGHELVGVADFGLYTLVPVVG